MPGISKELLSAAQRNPKNVTENIGRQKIRLRIVMKKKSES